MRLDPLRKMARLEERVISADDAAFWLDKHGKWHNRDGEFQSREIINYFNSSIRKDEQGYYISQAYKNVKEKVYFRYEGTALFVFDVKKNDGGLSLVLNTGKEFKLNPKKLFLHNDEIYIKLGREKAKFTSRALMGIESMISEDETGFLDIEIQGRRYTIKES